MPLSFAPAHKGFSFFNQDVSDFFGLFEATLSAQALEDIVKKRRSEGIRAAFSEVVMRGDATGGIVGRSEKAAVRAVVLCFWLPVFFLSVTACKKAPLPLSRKASPGAAAPEEKLGPLPIEEHLRFGNVDYYYRGAYFTTYFTPFERCTRPGDYMILNKEKGRPDHHAGHGHSHFEGTPDREGGQAGGIRRFRRWQNNKKPPF